MIWQSLLIKMRSTIFLSLGYQKMKLLINFFLPQILHVALEKDIKSNQESGY
jgi:hypothetical protein